MIKIKKFQWDKKNIRHLLYRHNVTRKEAEQIFVGDPYFRKGRDGTRYVYGQTESGRYLFVVYLYLGKEVVRVISARNMTDRERRLYLRR